METYDEDEYWCLFYIILYFLQIQYGRCVWYTYKHKSYVIKYKACFLRFTSATRKLLLLPANLSESTSIQHNIYTHVHNIEEL